jgi:hypothetical protein
LAEQKHVKAFVILANVKQLLDHLAQRKDRHRERERSDPACMKFWIASSLALLAMTLGAKCCATSVAVARMSASTCGSGKKPPDIANAHPGYTCSSP